MKWIAENPEDYAVIKNIPSEILTAMQTSQMQRHAHNWAITTEFFNSCQSLLDFWHVLAVDDGLP